MGGGEEETGGEERRWKRRRKRGRREEGEGECAMVSRALTAHDRLCGFRRLGRGERKREKERQRGARERECERERERDNLTLAEYGIHRVTFRVFPQWFDTLNLLCE